MEPNTPPAAPPIPAAVPPSATEHDHFYARVFAIATIALLGFALYQILQPFLGTLFWALFLAFLLHPLHLRITRRYPKRQNLSALFLTFATFIILIGPITALASMFVTQASDLVHWLQEMFAQQTHQQYRALAKLPLADFVLDWMRDNFGIRSRQVEQWIAGVALQLQPFIIGLGQRLFLGAINTSLAFVVMLFMLFFFLRDGAEFTAMFRDMIPMTPKRRTLLMGHMAAVTRAVVFGTGVTAVVQGLLVGMAFLVTGLDAPLVYGVLAALLALLPFGGTAFIWIPAVLILASQGRWDLTIVMLSMGVLSSTIDNVLRPLLISGRAEIGSLTVFIGVLGGVSAFGVIGFILGPVVLALIIALMRFALELRHAD
jgi:predicted PurR-regulated permease PerM